ncbi:MAG TPA: ribbon-helix-helix domain-containing protein [Vicinamibacteria bacterium]|jgi:metal-responsive CopG/Arc/MetJ family transcriptional regulator
MSTQISIRLPGATARRLDQVAKRRDARRSDVIREALEKYLLEEETSVGRPLDRVRDLVGVLSGGPPDLAERHREYLARLIGARL